MFDEPEVRDIDEEAGTATVAIGDACSGCGIAPTTMRTIERRLPESIEGLEDVEVVEGLLSESPDFREIVDERSEVEATQC
ncbi:hypothetical protein MBEHAL_1446 [Halarchaeum acidiphilum MH1-52-1]|uniref:Uncharacterized protein n=1 Tax=Halarchaeum acidiphilum MH1-52-1 TaxID=1261545 RepID=U2YFA8_9EURY|nr:NifU family protein [Halarchaeum acidiphilum]GAD52686.1 hypothetical protein MBEHAL_1446 [Halarchaeum acidiphilum MH1-52-1]